MKISYAVIVGLVLAAILFYAGFFGGRDSVNDSNREAQVETLKKDATAVAKNKVKEAARHAKNTTVLEQAKVEIPDDDFNRPISDAAIKRLCDLGAYCP